MIRVTEDGLKRCDTVLLCTSISSLEKVLPRLAPILAPGTVVMDCCSVKVEPARIMQCHLPESVSIIGTHPMFGPDSGSNGIEGLPIVLSRIRCTGEQERFWVDVFTGMGLKVLQMSPEEHDREAAYTQGITHFVGRVLKGLDLKESEMATLGYSSLLKIIDQTCNDPMQLFLDLQKYNPYTHDMRLNLQSVLNSYLEMMEEYGKKRIGSDDLPSDGETSFKV